MPDATTILRDYLNAIRQIKRTNQAVAETSYYGAMEALLNAIGASFKPSIFCVVNLRNRGSGIPDGGLFTENQQNVSVDSAGFAQLPARGAIEAKPTSQDIDELAKSEQVNKYLDRYGQVLVTNFYQFVLVTQDSLGNTMFSGTFSLANSEVEFWNTRVKDIVDEYADGLVSFLQHVMMSAAPISEPKDLAGILAFYAREAKRRIEHGNVNLDRLQEIKADFEGALGITFEGRKGENFFRSTLVQTLFYGIFSAWVLWHETPKAQQDSATFDWRLSPYLLHVPVIRGLVERLSMPSRVRQLGLEEVLQWTEDGINRVNRRAFFEKFNTGEAIQYFYEPFLEAFDPELREELGVWYTPSEVIRYMVERVDRILREELNRPDGLADKDVYILDPATGTGAYLVAVLERIYKTRLENDGEDAAKQAIKDAIQNVVGEEPTGRVFGFELLPAPFVVAHLQLGLLLQKYGVPLESDEERVGVYLTNSLTGWQPPEDKPKQLVIDAMRQERDQADTIKRKRKILVVLGNPPYNAFSGTSTVEENIAQDEGLVDKYKAGLRETWGIRKFNLDDLYIRFIRIAERVIAEQNAEGIVCYITNFSYLNYPSYVVMRQHLLEQFDHLWFDNLNGDSRETGKKTPDGKPDPSVFSTDFNRAGIRKGTAIGLMVRKNGARPDTKTVRYREFWGVNKRADLLASLSNGGTDFDTNYDLALPRAENRYSFAAWDVSNDYLNWPLVVDFANEHYNGPVERRGLALIDIDRSQLELRIKKYFDPSVTDEEINQLHPKLMMTGNRIVGPDARKKIQSEFTYDPTRIVRYPFKPFDIRWCYLENLRPLFSEPSPDLIALQEIEANRFFVTRSKSSKSDEGIPFLISPNIIDYDAISGHARHFPVFIYQRPARTKKQAEGQQYLFDQFDTDEPEIKANLSQKARAYLATLDIHNPDSDPEAAALIWRHALAIGYSPAYLEEHEEGIKNDWPRIPLPNDAALLRASATLGMQVADLLDTEKSILHITAGNIRDDLRQMGRQQGSDLAVRVNWGYADSRGAVMPGSGDARQRPYIDAEREAIERGAAALNIELDAALTLLGDTTYDLYLNDTTCWSNVPANVYGYTIGGYQVIKKWLSYRNFDVLGRALTGDEVREVTQMVRRLATLILLEPQLNSNYRDVKANVYDWNT